MGVVAVNERDPWIAATVVLIIILLIIAAGVVGGELQECRLLMEGA